MYKSIYICLFRRTPAVLQDNRGRYARLPFVSVTQKFERCFSN